MRKRILGALAALLLLAATACEGAKNTGQGAMVSDEIPAGTLMMWIDFSWFAYVPAGEGIIGHDELVASDHAPQHTVELDGFWIQQSEVSNRQYLGCVSAGACTPPALSDEYPYWFGMAGYADHPVTGVTWEQAEAYCSWIYARLPSEAEWEIAARGTAGVTYPWGEDPLSCARVNYLGCQDPPGPTAKGEQPDGKGPYNALDMLGNVREWVHDWYAPDWYPGAVGGPASGVQRSVRGGGFLTSADSLFPWMREALEPDRSAPDLGFRCALNERIAQAPAPYCQVPPLVDQPAPPLLNPPPPPQFTVNGYCDNNNTGVVVTVTGGDPSDYIVIGPQGILQCMYSTDHMACWGPGLAQDTTVLIRVCPECPPGFYYDWDEGGCRPFVFEPGPYEVVQPGDVPLCPEGQVYIPHFGCFHIGGPPIDIECLPGFYYAEGCGCILEGAVCLAVVEPDVPDATVEDNTQELQVAICEPDPIPMCQDDSIPTQVAPGCWACLPWDPGADGDGGNWNIDSFFDVFTELDPGDIGPSLAPDMIPQLICGPNTLPPKCGLFQYAYQDEDDCWHCKPWFEIGDDCPEGSHYDAAAGCCVPDKPLPQGCPKGYIYDAQLNACVPIPPKQECQIFKVYIPVCVSTEPVCFNPTQYLNEADCTNASCRWVPSVTGAPFCTYP